jgi:serine/threonine protein kinase
MADLFESLTQALRLAYALERELGGGRMSRVFLATDTGLGRRVVVKVLAPEQVAADPGTDHRADLYALGAVGRYRRADPGRGAGDQGGALQVVGRFCSPVDVSSSRDDAGRRELGSRPGFRPRGDTAPPRGSA